MRALAPSLALLVFLSLLSSPALAGEAPPQECFGARPGMAAERRIEACTAAIAAPMTSAVDRAIAWANRGKALHDRGRPKEALADLDRALRLLPTLVPALLLHGLILEGQGRHAWAVRDFEDAIWLEPRYAPIRIYRGFAYGTDIDLERAERSYRLALRDDREFWAAHARGSPVFEERESAAAADRWAMDELRAIRAEAAKKKAPKPR